jgi:hypothetical protein
MIRWLGWIAHRVPDRRDFTWEDIPKRFHAPSPSRRLTCLFDDAVEHGVLSRPVNEHDKADDHKAGYRFEDAAVQADLAAAYQATLTGTARKVIAFLAADHIDRLMTDGIFCLGVIVVAMNWQQVMQLNLWTALLALCFFGFVLVFVGGFLVGLGVVSVTSVAEWLAAGPMLTRLHRALWAGADVAAISLITALFGLARAVPAALLAACGLLVCVLIGQLVHVTRPGRRKTLMVRVVDIVAIATMSTTVLVLSHNDLLTTMPAAGFLFPLAIWGSVRVWRAMVRSGRLPTRAAADIVLSLLLGGILVVFLVWLADTFGMPRPEMATLRAALQRTGDIANLPWWVWTTLYVLLA